jgi:predicted dehydrogenase
VSLAPVPAAQGAGGRPARVGFLGVGWIGRSRMAALHDAGLVDAVAAADPNPAALAAAAEAIPSIAAAETLEDLLARDLDGLVIATPSALHAEQAIAALSAGVAVFCQKPLARDASEARGVIDAARGADRLLGVDLSYRHLAATRAAGESLQRGELGEMFAADLVFHNAYGPDKPWFARRSLSGGGCLIDLGTHLIDLAFWLTGAQGAEVEASHLRYGGQRLDLAAQPDAVEDFALATLRTDVGVILRLACSWHLAAGADCVIECTLYGTGGAFCIRNVGGSFYDFVARRHHGTRAELVVSPPDDWGPRAITAWAQALGQDGSYEPEVEGTLAVSEVIDEVYRQAR